MGLVHLANYKTADPLYHPLKGTLDLATLDDDTVDWLQRTALSIWWLNSTQTKKIRFQT